MKTWRSDRFIWKTQDGSFKAVSDQRIPSDAVTLAYGVGSEVPEDLALQNGWISPPQEAKAIEAPAENKAIVAPEQKKTRSKKDKVA